MNILLCVEKFLLKDNLLAIKKIDSEPFFFDTNKEIINIINSKQKNINLLIIIRNKTKGFSKKEDLVLSYFKKRSNSKFIEVNYAKDNIIKNSIFTDIVVKGFEEKTWDLIIKIINNYN